MAIMWPREIPTWISSDKRRGAEIKVFNKLREVLDDSWEVFYSRPWWGLLPTGGEIDGEADFILGNPDLGILFIEVKGGGIEYDPKSSKWFSTDRYATKYTIKNPVEQAKSCKYRFYEKLSQYQEWPKERVRMRYGVVFTDTSPPANDSPALGGYDLELFCHSTDFEKFFDQWITHRLREHLDSSIEIGPGKTGLGLLRRLVASPVQLKTVARRVLENEMEKMDDLLTGVQVHVLTQLIDLKRAVIEGGAGTGKTLLAVEAAASFSALGKEVLVTCSSEALCEDLKNRLTAYPKIAIRTLSNLMITIEQFSQNQKWDLIIVDEGQDVDTSMWSKIENCLSGVESKLFVFMDSNQAIYRTADDLATRILGEHFLLRVNLRNTKRISELTQHLYKGPLIYCYGPEGDRPKMLPLNSESEIIQKVIELVREITTEEEIPGNMITVLVSNTRLREKITKELNRNGIFSGNVKNRTMNLLTVETVAEFKGLETPIAIVVGDNQLSSDQELSYIAVSRARTRLYVVGAINSGYLNKAFQNLSA